MKKKNLLINEIVETAKGYGVSQLFTEDEGHDGRIITINGKQLINFGSYSYLGLEVDERLKLAAMNAIQRYGITYPSSRAYASSPLYKELEELVERMYLAPIVLATSLSLGHHGVMPVVVEEGDAIIMDQQVHSSVQDAARKLRNNGVYLDIVRHNQLDQLEEKIRELISKNANQKIWYLCDGVYSMYGDVAPLEELIVLANRYKNFYLYIDDAHGMTAFGPNGTGYVVSKVGLHPKMILSTGMAKAFGSIGGIFIIPDKELAIKVRNCAGPLIFSGQQATPLLAASIASAKIHLSKEISVRQQELADKIAYCHKLLKEYHLPNISDSETPIFFIGLGTIGLGFNMVKRMMNEGFFTNIAAFPAVPEINTGIRFTITLHITFEDIRKFVQSLAKHFPLALKEEGKTVQDIHRAFKKIANLEYMVEFYKPREYHLPNEATFDIQYETTIDNIPSSLWNNLLGNRGAFTADALKLMERTFKNNIKQEHNLSFHYYIIYDKNQTPILATFFTVGLTKNDMLSPYTVSEQIEEMRINKPYYLSSKAMIMGSVVTEGNHLFLDRTNANWKQALKILLNMISEEQEKQGIEILMLRDFDAEDKDFNEFFLNQGFLKTSLPDTHVIKELNWKDKDSFLATFNNNKRQYLKQKVFGFEQFFDVKIVESNNCDIDHYYNLYKHVSKKSFEVNTFTLPLEFFKNISKDENWEIIELKLKPEFEVRKTNDAVAVMFCLKTKFRYCPLFIGMDYQFIDYNIYPQILWQTLQRAKDLNLSMVNLGFTASQNKRKFGAEAIPQIGFIQMKDNFNMALIGLTPNELKHPGNSQR